MTPEEELHFRILEKIQKEFKKLQEEREELNKTEIESIKYLMENGFGLPIIAESIGISPQGLRHRLVIGYYNGEVLATPRQKTYHRK